MGTLALPTLDTQVVAALCVLFTNATDHERRTSWRPRRVTRRPALSTARAETVDDMGANVHRFGIELSALNASARGRRTL